MQYNFKMMRERAHLLYCFVQQAIYDKTPWERDILQILSTVPHMQLCNGYQSLENLQYKYAKIIYAYQEKKDYLCIYKKTFLPTSISTIILAQSIQS